MKVSANLGWAAVVATLVMTIGLGAILPPSESGPANAGRFVIGIWLVACLLLTLVAWAARGRWRALVVWTAAAPIWLWFAYVLAVSFISPDPDKSRVAFLVGMEVVSAVVAGTITAIGMLFWRAKSMNDAPLAAVGNIGAFLGLLAGKTNKVASIDEINDAAADGWADQP